jgi:hypothetical protein
MCITMSPKVQDCIGSEVFQHIKTMNHIGMKFYIDTRQVQPSAKTPPQIFSAPHYLHQNLCQSNPINLSEFYFISKNGGT